jgi:hypothetical protein
MHLSFCPITQGKKGMSLSAKALLGNQAQLSKWQDSFHACMSERYPELERGISSMITKRKHIPLSLFKQAERLDKEFAAIAAALDGINHFNAPKKREAALSAFQRIMPQVAKFTATVKQYDSYIKELEQAEKDTKKRIAKAESCGDERVRSVQNTMQNEIDGKDREIAVKDKAILAAQHEAYLAADKLRRQSYHFEGIIGRMPLSMRDKYYEIVEQMKTKSEKERGRTR